VKNLQEYEVVINYDLCSICEDCISACDEDVFELDPDEYKVIVVNEGNCTGCENCVEGCVVDAIYVGETVEKRKADIEAYISTKKERDKVIKELLETTTPDEFGDYRIPLSEVLQLLKFRHEEELEEWLISKDEFIGFVEGEVVVITTTEMDS
jgi:NAD-dependent dihydropyrimidine dehydrogenase PreA subunit